MKLILGSITLALIQLLSLPALAERDVCQITSLEKTEQIVFPVEGSHFLEGQPKCFETVDEVGKTGTTCLGRNASFDPESGILQSEKQ